MGKRRLSTEPNVVVACNWQAIAAAIRAAQAWPGQSDYVIGVGSGVLTGGGVRG